MTATNDSVPPWTVPALDDAASRITAALLAARGIYAVPQAVATFWQVREALLKGPPAAARPIWDDPAVCDVLGVPK